MIKYLVFSALLLCAALPSPARAQIGPSGPSSTTNNSCTQWVGTTAKKFAGSGAPCPAPVTPGIYTCATVTVGPGGNITAIANGTCFISSANALLIQSGSTLLIQTGSKLLINN